MAKFKVGDIVVSHCDQYGITKTGWKGVVTGFPNYSKCSMRVRGKDLEGDNVEFDVDIEDFDLVRDQHKIVIRTDGKTTTATHYDGKRVISKKTARCNPDDEFDFMTGAEIAFDRLTGRDGTKKRNLHELMTPGTFGKTERYDQFVVVGNIMVFKDGGWMPIGDYSMDTLESRHGDKILYLVKPSISSFNVAALEYDDDKNVV